jgi:anti-sigma B factor antagonist
MSPPAAKLSVLAGDGFACVKIAGRATFGAATDFQTLLDELRGRGCRCFLLELTECVLMDSTFLGVLAAFAVKLNAGDGGAARTLELYHASPRIVELLETLGVIELFTCSQGPLDLPGPAEASSPAPLNPSQEQVTRTCLKAHQALMEINPANVARFKDVAQFLAEDLKKETGQPPADG